MPPPSYVNWTLFPIYEGPKSRDLHTGQTQSAVGLCVWRRRQHRNQLTSERMGGAYMHLHMSLLEWKGVSAEPQASTHQHAEVLLKGFWIQTDTGVYSEGEESAAR